MTDTMILAASKKSEIIELDGCQVKLNFRIVESEQEHGDSRDIMDFIKSVLTSP